MHQDSLYCRNKKSENVRVSRNCILYVDIYSNKKDSHPKSPGKLDQITSSDIVSSQERRERVNRVVDTRILRERKLNIPEDDHGTICTVALECPRLGEADSVVEGQTKRLMGIFTALILEEICLQIISEREEYTALC